MSWLAGAFLVACLAASLWCIWQDGYRQGIKVIEHEQWLNSPPGG